MRKFILVLAILIIKYSIRAQTLHRSVIAEFAGLNAYSTKHIESSSFVVNPAALAGVKQPGLSIGCVRQYMMPELSRYSAVAAWPSSPGNFGLEFGYSGFANYNESKLGIAYARTLGSSIDAGIQFNYAQVKIAGYGAGSAIYAELGVLLHLTTKLHAGLQASNPIGGYLGKNKLEKIPTVYRTAIGFDVSEKFFVGCELEKTEGDAVSMQASFQYLVVPALSLRMGIRSLNKTAWLAAGILIRKYRLDVLAGYHPELGLTTGLQIISNLGKAKKVSDG